MTDCSVRISVVVATLVFAGCFDGPSSDAVRSRQWVDDDQPETSSYAAPDQSGPASNTITPVLFIPTDEQVDGATVDALQVGLADLEAWYERELETSRLRLEPLQTVNGEHEAAYYLEDDHIWSEGPSELVEALGFSPWQEGHIVLLVGAGLMGWAGGNGTGVAGYAVLGLESLTGSSRCAGEWWCTPTVWRGTAIHELGHALTLPHSCEPSIMSFHGDYLDKALLETATWPEKSTVRALPFVEPLGGGSEQPDPDPDPDADPDPDPDPDPTTCDGGAALGDTACDGSDSSYEKICAVSGGQPAWLQAPCSPGQSCQGGRCQATTTGCAQYGSVQACNDHGVSCAWYACADRCMPKGTPLETACGCGFYTNVSACDAATTDGCAWYACSSSCWAQGTPMDLACP